MGKRSFFSCAGQRNGVKRKDVPLGFQMGGQRESRGGGGGDDEKEEKKKRSEAQTRRGREAIKKTRLLKLACSSKPMLDDGMHSGARAEVQYLWPACATRTSEVQYLH